MAPVTGAKKEATRSNAARRTLEFNRKFAAQYIEGLILTSMGVRWCTRAWRNHGFPEREGTPGLGGRRLVGMDNAEHVEGGTGGGRANERFGCCDFESHRRSPACERRDHADSCGNAGWSGAFPPQSNGRAEVRRSTRLRSALTVTD